MDGKYGLRLTTHHNKQVWSLFALQDMAGGKQELPRTIGSSSVLCPSQIHPCESRRDSRESHFVAKGAKRIRNLQPPLAVTRVRWKSPQKIVWSMFNNFMSRLGSCKCMGWSISSAFKAEIL